MNETMLSEIQCVTEMCMVRGVEYSASCRVELKPSEKKNVKNRTKKPNRGEDKERGAA